MAATNISMKSTSAMDNKFNNTVVKRAKKCAAALPNYRGSWTQIKNESGRNLVTVRRAILKTNHRRRFIVDGIDVLTEIVKQAMNKDEEIPF